MVFVDGQNLYFKCKSLFGHGWIHPGRLAEALVREDQHRHGQGSHVLSGVRYYTGIHDLKHRHKHRPMARRLHAYANDGVLIRATPLRYDSNGRGREKGVDTRLCLDLVRLAQKGLYDVGIIMSEDSDFVPAIEEVYRLRDDERWLAVENALPWAPHSKPRWLRLVRRHRRITKEVFDRVIAPGAYTPDPETDEWHDFS